MSGRLFIPPPGPALRVADLQGTGICRGNVRQPSALRDELRRRSPQVAIRPPRATAESDAHSAIVGEMPRVESVFSRNRGQQPMIFVRAMRAIASKWHSTEGFSTAPLRLVDFTRTPGARQGSAPGAAELAYLPLASLGHSLWRRPLHRPALR